MIIRTLPHAACLAVLSMLVFASMQPQSSAAAPQRDAGRSQNRGPSTSKPSPIAIRVPIDPLTGRNMSTGRILVRVKEEFGVRASAYGQDGPIETTTGSDLTPLTNLLAQLDAVAYRAVDLTPKETAALRARAVARSGRPSRDLGDWLAIVPAGDLLSAAYALRNLELIDRVQLEAWAEQAQCDPGDCNSGDNPFCANPCNAPADPANGGGCNTPGSGPCAALVTALRGSCTGTPACADPPGTALWDEGCVALAAVICPLLRTPGLNSVYSPASGPGAFDACGTGPASLGIPAPPLGWPEQFVTTETAQFGHHQFGASTLYTASREPDCCNAVCFADFICCTVAWDSGCAAAAMNQDNCYLLRDHFADPADPEVIGDPTMGVSIYESNPDLIGFNPGTPSAPSTSPTPYFGSSLLTSDNSMGPFPLAKDQSTTLALSQGSDKLSIADGAGGVGPFAPGSMPLALWDTPLRQRDPILGNPLPFDPDFVRFQGATTFQGGGLNLPELASLASAFPSTEETCYPVRIAGDGLRIGVVDFSMFVNHQEFVDASTGETRIQIENGQGIVLLPPSQGDVPASLPNGFVTYSHHGTAVMGVLAANADQVGVTGLVHNAEPWFFPALAQSGLFRLSGALAGAAFELTTPTDCDPSPSNVCVVPLANFAVNR